MGNGIFKTLVAVILLAAAAFLCGSLAADGIKSAILPILLLVGSFSLLYLGKNCWWVIYIMVAFTINSPRAGMASYVFSALCFIPAIYWLVMAILGHVRITWYGVVIIDVLVALLAGYMVVSWFRHPVYMSVMLNRVTAVDSILVGGADYVICFFALLAYIAVSIVPVSFEHFKKAIKFFAWASLFITFVYMMRNILMPANDAISQGEEEAGLANSRNFMFVGFALPLMIFLLSKYTVWNILISPWKIVLAALASFGLLVSGFRSYMITVLVAVLLAQWLYRRLMSTVLLIVFFLGGVVFLSQQNALDFLPFGAKRALSPLPGIQFEDSAAIVAAQKSADWRFLMWKWALDPSKGYIKDYVWGDGFGQRLDEMRREYASFHIVKSGLNQQKRFARRGQWHSGPIAVIHRLGIVGLCVVVVWTIVISAYALRVLRALDSVSGKEYIYFVLITLLTKIVNFYASAGTVTFIFISFYSAAIVKVCYCHLRKMELIKPFFVKSTYVPLMIKELDAGVAAGRN